MFSISDKERKKIGFYLDRDDTDRGMKTRIANAKKGRIIVISDMQGCPLERHDGKDLTNANCKNSFFRGIGEFLARNKYNKVVFIGEFFNKGPYVMTTILNIYELRQKFKKRVVIVLGPADIEKLRFKYELDHHLLQSNINEFPGFNHFKGGASILKRGSSIISSIIADGKRSVKSSSGSNNSNKNDSYLVKGMLRFRKIGKETQKDFKPDKVYGKRIPYGTRLDQKIKRKEEHGMVYSLYTRIRDILTKTGHNKYEYCSLIHVNFKDLYYLAKHEQNMELMILMEQLGTFVLVYPFISEVKLENYVSTSEIKFIIDYLLDNIKNIIEKEKMYRDDIYVVRMYELYRRINRLREKEDGKFVHMEECPNLDTWRNKCKDFYSYSKLFHYDREYNTICVWGNSLLNFVDTFRPFIRMVQDDDNEDFTPFEGKKSNKANADKKIVWSLQYYYEKINIMYNRYRELKYVSKIDFTGKKTKSKNTELDVEELKQENEQLRDMLKGYDNFIQHEFNLVDNDANILKGQSLGLTQQMGGESNGSNSNMENGDTGGTMEIDSGNGSSIRTKGFKGKFGKIYDEGEENPIGNNSIDSYYYRYSFPDCVTLEEDEARLVPKCKWNNEKQKPRGEGQKRDYKHNPYKSIDFEILDQDINQHFQETLEFRESVKDEKYLNKFIFIQIFFLFIKNNNHTINLLCPENIGLHYDLYTHMYYRYIYTIFMGGYVTGLSFPLIMEDIFGITLVFTKISDYTRRKMPVYKEVRYTHDDYDEMGAREILKMKNYPIVSMGKRDTKGGSQLEITSLLSNGKLRSKKTHLGDHFISHDFLNNFVSTHKNMEYNIMEFFEVSINQDSHNNKVMAYMLPLFQTDRKTHTVRKFTYLLNNYIYVIRMDEERDDEAAKRKYFILDLENFGEDCNIGSYYGDIAQWLGFFWNKKKLYNKKIKDYGPLVEDFKKFIKYFFVGDMYYPIEEKKQLVSDLNKPYSPPRLEDFKNLKKDDAPLEKDFTTSETIFKTNESFVDKIIDSQKLKYTILGRNKNIKTEKITQMILNIQKINISLKKFRNFFNEIFKFKPLEFKLLFSPSNIYELEENDTEDFKSGITLHKNKYISVKINNKDTSSFIEGEAEVAGEGQGEIKKIVVMRNDEKHKGEERFVDLSFNDDNIQHMKELSFLIYLSENSNSKMKNFANLEFLNISPLINSNINYMIKKAENISLDQFLELEEGKDYFKKSENIMDFIEQILDGLTYIHSKYIIHNDLFPRNILVYEGKKGKKEFKICDFGISEINHSHLLLENDEKLKKKDFDFENGDIDIYGNKTKLKTVVFKIVKDVNIILGINEGFTTLPHFSCPFYSQKKYITTYNDIYALGITILEILNVVNDNNLNVITDSDKFKIIKKLSCSNHKINYIYKYLNHIITENGDLNVSGNLNTNETTISLKDKNSDDTYSTKLHELNSVHEIINKTLTKYLSEKIFLLLLNLIGPYGVRAHDADELKNHIKKNFEHTIFQNIITEGKTEFKSNDNIKQYLIKNNVYEQDKIVYIDESKGTETHKIYSLYKTNKYTKKKEFKVTLEYDIQTPIEPVNSDSLEQLPTKIVNPATS